jgi:probable phosphoglycerate mutase
VRLVLIRHGESHHNLSGVIGGPVGCAGLTERGVRQARALARRLAATGELSDCRAVLCSPWPRARQTAEELLPSLPVDSVAIDDGLCELLPGEADGLPWETYRARYEVFDPEAFPTRPFSPGGESWSDFTNRVEAMLGRLAERFDGQTVVAVTHGGVVVLSFCALFGIAPFGAGRRAYVDPAHTSLTEWAVSGRTWRLVRYNDAGHLANASYLANDTVNAWA